MMLANIRTIVTALGGSADALNFAVATAVLCSRIEQLLERQGVLVELECPEEVNGKRNG